MVSTDGVIMKTPNLQKYVDEKNVLSGIFGTPAIDISNMTPTLKQDLIDQIESELSPENLCCDGEVSITYVRQREAFLKKALAELDWM